MRRLDGEQHAWADRRMRTELDGRAVLLRGLDYPDGLAVRLTGDLWFTESVAHRLSRAPMIGSRRDRRDRKSSSATCPAIRRGSAVLGMAASGSASSPAHPFDRIRVAGGRLSRRNDANHLRPLIGLRPRSGAPGDCLEPMQSGSIKALGIQKPWAPPRSYGLRRAASTRTVT